MKSIKINDIDYSVDSSGAIPENYDNGIVWILNDQLHRIDGPAIIFNNGYQAWYQFDELHREDGPAVEWKNKRKVKKWYYRGKLLGSSRYGYTQEDFEQYVYLLKHPELKVFQ